MSKKAYFNFCWFSNPCYYDWISHGSSNEEERCKLPKCVIKLSNVGETALQRHAGSKNHKQKNKNMIQVKNPSEKFSGNVELASSVCHPPDSMQTTIMILFKNQILKK